LGGLLEGVELLAEMGDRLVFLGDRVYLSLVGVLEGIELLTQLSEGLVFLGDRLGLGCGTAGRVRILAAEGVNLLLKCRNLLNLLSNYTVFFFIQSSFSASCKAWRADCIRFS